MFDEELKVCAYAVLRALGIAVTDFHVGVVHSVLRSRIAANCDDRCIHSTPCNDRYMKFSTGPLLP